MSLVAVAQQFKVNSIVIDCRGCVQTSAGANVAGGYITITNTDSEPDRLIGGRLPQAGHFAVHEMKMDGNVMHMDEVRGGLEIKPGQKVQLNPSGYHVMFTELRDPLKQGDTLKGQLRFEKADPVDIEYHVESLGAQGPQHHGH